MVIVSYEKKEILLFKNFQMMEKTEIQVFVSCPGDVVAERGIVNKVCEELSARVKDFCNICFVAKDWISFIREIDERPLETVELFKDSNLFIEILWMHFSSKTGKLNSITKKESESGSEEDFLFAYECYKAQKVQEIKIFIKNQGPTKNSYEILQLKKVQNFIEEQSKQGWVYPFFDQSDFELKIIKTAYPLRSSLKKTRNKYTIFHNN